MKENKDGSIEYFDENMDGKQAAEEAAQDRVLAGIEADAKRRAEADAAKATADAAAKAEAERKAALANKGIVENPDGTQRYDNGKPAGPAPKPNQDDPNIPKGGFAAQKQAAMDAASEKLLEKLRQNNPNGYSDATLLENYAIAHNNKVPRPVDKTNVGPKVTVVGGQDSAAERHRKFVERNPNAVSPQEREQVLGGGQQPTASWAAAAQKQQDDEIQARMSAFEAQREETRNDSANRKRMQAERRAAMGEAFGVALDGLRAPVTENDPRIRTSKDGKHRYLMSSVSEGGIKSFNERMRSNGGKSDYANVVAYAEIDTNGNIIGQPQLAFRDIADGQSGTQKSARFRKMAISHYEPMLRDAYRTLGYNDAQADYMTRTVTGGYGSIGAEQTKQTGLTFEQRQQLQKERQEALDNREDRRITSSETIAKENRESRERANIRRGIISQLRDLQKNPHKNKQAIEKLMGKLDDMDSANEAVNEKPDNATSPTDDQYAGETPTGTAKTVRQGDKWVFVDKDDKPIGWKNVK